MLVRAVRDFADGDVDFILLAHEIVPFGTALPRALPLRCGLRLLLRRYSRLRLITVRAVEIVANAADDEQEEADDDEDATADQEARLA